MYGLAVCVAHFIFFYTVSHYNGLYTVLTQAAFKGRAHKTKHTLCNYTKQSENNYRLMIAIVVLVKMCWSLPQSLHVLSIGWIQVL